MPEVASEGKIIIKGARVNNLKSVNLTLERDQLIVITGLSGSGNLRWPLIPYMPKVSVVMSKAFRHMPGSFSDAFKSRR